MTRARGRFPESFKREAVGQVLADTPLRHLTNPHTGDRKALVKDGVATLSLDERKVIVRPWLENLA
nr:hypothetical protein [Pseudomonas sp. ALS1279]